MHLFDPNLSLKENCLAADDVEYAAWELAGHEHREQYRDSGNSLPRTAWLHFERMRALKDALVNGELIALGIAKDDPSLEIRQIPENFFLGSDLVIDGDRSSVSAMGREFDHVGICRSIPGQQLQPSPPKAAGRPTHFPAIMAAWDMLKIEIPGFLELDKTVQNREIGEVAAKLFPAKYPGKNRIGDSTIRRHRRKHPKLFV